jgi:TrmH family RNA methyltransferase
MIPVYKLERLPAGQRRRKLAMLLSSCERAYASGSAWGVYTPDYVRDLVRLSLEDPAIDPEVREDAARALARSKEAGETADCDASGDHLLRACNRTRHGLLAAIGTFPAEWDLILRDPRPTGVLHASGTMRPFHPGVMAYAEDIRSPFNLGSIFRTAEAFGAERLYVSPLCVSPDHPRAQRSAMGCIEFLPWQQTALDDLPAEIPAFALETGGIPIEEFDFPERGIVLLGSEELGLSPEALARATYGRVSIPMKGIKASLNVGVAFGILMQAWTSYLACSASNPA